ncbi:helix-turn-helix domain-containing protein [Rhizobium laguerreae]|uniref:helix-turn-helix domain-containing protein n=1 Tax=Rhizobium laguerreae TaxID=1076926 RepID=UPI001C8FBA58|nr:helix-turn-helix transcriptional regulator [Rhizobium laguerreae]MBY3382544.1 helix-turn-helix transcriptional regulator [Rhizobium laguerreae]
MRNDRTGKPAKAKLRNSRQAEVSEIHPVDRYIGQQIRIRRIQSDLSLSALAKGIGVSLQQVQKYESGKNRVSASMPYEVACRLKVPVAKFFEGLPDPGTGDLTQIAANVDERIVYISTAEGRELIGNMLQLPPHVRGRLLSLVSALLEE